MVYSQTALSGATVPEVKFVRTWQESIEHTVPLARSPFLPKSKLRSLYKFLLRHTVSIIESVFSVNLYCDNDKALLYQLSPETRSLLDFLNKKQLLDTWHFGRSIPGSPRIPTLYIYPNFLVTPQGTLCRQNGANGIGAGKDYLEASKSALGEFIERNASGTYWWENYSFRNKEFVPKSKMVDIQEFNVWNVDTDLKASYWVTGHSMTKKRKVLLPASLVYMFFAREYPEEPKVCPVSSNGAATYTNLYEAKVRALQEVIERHNFLRFWYCKESFVRISLASLAEDYEEAKMLLEKMSPDTEVIVLDITGELQVPTITVIMKTKNTERTAVHVTATTDLDIRRAMRKTLQEIIRFSDGMFDTTSESVPDEAFTDLEKMQAYTTDIRTRKYLWSDQRMLPYLDWITEGEEITYKEILDKCELYSTNSSVDRYNILRKKMAEHSVRVYFADVTNSVAKYAGLKVARALSPDLLPIFFNEKGAPAEHPVFKNFTKDLNPVPHPFL